MSDIPTRALSVFSPYAWALIYGGKNIENRSTNFTKKFRGRFWVHASRSTPVWELKMTLDEMRGRFWDANGPVDITTLTPVPSLDYMNSVRGHIIGSVELHAVSTPDSPPDSHWYVPGSLALHVRDPLPLRRPVMAKGGLGLWRPSETELAACRRPGQ